LVRGGRRVLPGEPASLMGLGWVNREGLKEYVLKLFGGLLALPVVPQLLALCELFIKDSISIRNTEVVRVWDDSPLAVFTWSWTGDGVTKVHVSELLEPTHHQLLLTEVAKAFQTHAVLVSARELEHLVLFQGALHAGNVGDIVSDLSEQSHCAATFFAAIPHKGLEMGGGSGEALDIMLAATQANPHQRFR